MADSIQEKLDLLRKERLDAIEEERREKRLKEEQHKHLKPATPRIDGKKTTQPEMPAVVLPHRSEHAKRIERINELYAKRYVLMRERMSYSGAEARLLITGMIQQKGDGIREVGRLLWEAAMEGDPDKKKQLQKEAAILKESAEACEAQIEKSKLPGKEQAEIDEALEQVDTQLRALGVNVPAPTPRVGPDKEKVRALTVKVADE